MMAYKSSVKNCLEFLFGLQQLHRNQLKLLIYHGVSTRCTMDLLIEINQQNILLIALIAPAEQFIDKIRPVQNNAFEEIAIKLKNISKRESKFVKPSSTPPLFLKGCKLENVTATEISLSIEDWPTVIMGNGCSVNFAAGTKLNDYLRLLTPSIRCTVRAADGSIKRLTNSKTRNLQVKSDFLPNLSSVLIHSFPIHPFYPPSEHPKNLTVF